MIHIESKVMPVLSADKVLNKPTVPTETFKTGTVRVMLSEI
jgi:hypothetical protein